MKTNGKGGALPRGYRLGKLGFSLVGSYLGYQVQNILLGETGKPQRKANFHKKASRQVREELGALKGPAMKLGQLLSLQNGILRDLMGARLCEAYETQLQHLRVIHADQHPGNFLFQPDGHFGLVDFGCVKRVNFDVLELRRFQEDRGWRESEAAERRFLTILYGKGIPFARARKILPLMEEMLDVYRPPGSGDYVIEFRTHRQNAKAVEIRRRMTRLFLRDKLLNPDFICFMRSDMGLWHLIGEMGATVNVSEVCRRVSAAPVNKGK